MFVIVCFVLSTCFYSSFKVNQQFSLKVKQITFFDFSVLVTRQVHFVKRVLDECLQLAEKRQYQIHLVSTNAPIDVHLISKKTDTDKPSVVRIPPKDPLPPKRSTPTATTEPVSDELQQEQSSSHFDVSNMAYTLCFVLGHFYWAVEKPRMQFAAFH